MSLKETLFIFTILCSLLSGMATAQEKQPDKKQKKPFATLPRVPEWADEEEAKIINEYIKMEKPIHDDLGETVISCNGLPAYAITKCISMYEKDHPDAKLGCDYNGGDFGAVEWLDWKITDAIVTMQPLYLHLRERLDKTFPPSKKELEYHPYARWGIAIIASKNTGAVSLTEKQVFDIFLGKITEWKQLGLKGGKIRWSALQKLYRFQREPDSVI